MCQKKSDADICAYEGQVQTMEHIPWHSLTGQPRTWCSLVWTVSKHAANMLWICSEAELYCRRTNQKLSVFRMNTKAFLAAECWFGPTVCAASIFFTLSNIMFMAAAVAVPQNMFDSLYRPWKKHSVSRRSLTAPFSIGISSSGKGGSLHHRSRRVGDRWQPLPW